MSNRHARRRSEAAYKASIKRYQAESGKTLWTYLVARDEVLDAPLLTRTRTWWLSTLPRFTPLRQCIACNDDMFHGDQVGGLLLSTPTPDLAVAAVSCSGICVGCWHGADLAAIERAAERVLGLVIANGRLERWP